MTQQVKQEDPSSIPSTQVKTWSWLVAHTSNPSTERAKAGSSSGNAGQRASQIPGGDHMVPWECRLRLTSDLHMYMPTMHAHSETHAHMDTHSPVHLYPTTGTGIFCLLSCPTPQPPPH